MKKIKITLLIILCYSFNAIATINLNVQGGFGPTNSAIAIQAYACQTNTFNLTLSDSIPIYVAPSSSLYLRIDNAAFIQFPQLITLLPDTDSRYFEIYHNSDPVNPFAFSLSAFLMTTPMVVGCDFIMQTSSSVSHGIGLYMNGDLSANITGTFNGDTIANGQISYDVYYPYLAIQGASTPLEVDYLTVHLPNNRVERTLSYVNNGSTDSITAMELNFVFTDRLQCESFEFDSIYYYIDGASPIAIPITPNDSVETPVINIQLIHGQVLHIREVITLKDNCFLSDCDDAERTFNSNLNWGCSTLCMNIPDQARIVRGHLRPGLTLNRISPARTNTINVPGSDFYWDTLFSQQPITNYTFRLANRDSDIVNSVRFVIGDYISSSMYFVADTDSISIHPSFSDFRNYHSTVLPYSTAGKLPSCVRDFYPNAVREFVFFVDYLMPFDSIDITVPLIYCCPDNDNGIDTTVINLFENSKRLNSWSVNAQGVSDCNQSPATAAITTLSNAYLHNIPGNQFSLNDGSELNQLDLKQNFIPNGITFSVPHDSLCSPFTSLALNNFQFNEDANGDFLFRDANLFTKSFSTVQTDTIRVDSLFLQFRIRTEPGLRISNSLTDFSINSATHHWAASELILAHSDSCSLSNVYTVTFSSANFPFLNSAAPFLREVYELVKSSDFNFDIRGCCCASSSNNNPNYIIETLIAGYDHCFIPMKKVDGNSEIHCPGCNMPGTIVQTPDDQILERTNFGYYDANDNGLADSTLVRIDSTYLLAHRSQMDINHSMVGDTLSSTMSVRIDNTGAISIDSLASLGVVLTHLYAEQKIEMSNSSQFDLHPFQLTITLVATNQSVTITPLSTHWNQIVKDVRDSIGINGKLDIIFYNLSPALLDTIFGISNYAFAGGEEIILQVNLKVCKNYQPDRDSKSLVNNQFASKVGLNMYLTDANLDSLNIYDAFTSHNLNYPVAQDTGVIFANELYMCETRSAMHYFYSIYSRSFSGISYDFARPCIRILDIDHEVAIGGEKLNPFRREFRPIPEFFPILINLPGGIANYHFYNDGYGRSDVRTYYTSGCGISSLHSSFTGTNLVFSPIFSNPHAIARDSLITSVAFAPTCGSNFNAQSNLFYSGDEYLNQRLSFPLTYTVCNDTAYARIDSTTITTNLQVTTCSSNSITALSKINTNNPIISTNFVTGFLSSTPLSVNATQNRVEFQIELEGTYNYDRLIRNLFIYFPDTTAYTDITIDTFPAHHLILPNGTKIVYFELGNMTSVIFDSIYPVFININNCDLDSIPFVVGFDCLGYPTLLQLQTGNICQLYSRSLHLQIIEAKVTATIEQNVSINTCQIDTITTTLNTIGSNVNDLRFKLDLLNSFTQIISARDRRYHNGNAISDSILTSHPSSNHYEFTPFIPIDDFVLGDSIKFDVVYSLLDSTDSQPFSIDFQYTNLCGDIGPPAAQDTALVIGGFNCDMGVANCFQVIATQNSINCAGSPVNISTSIIGHSAGLTYSWSSNPFGFISTDSIINPSPLVSTTYIVVVSDTSGTTSTDSVTVTPIPVDSCCIPPGFNLSTGDLELFNTSASAYIQQYGANIISTQNQILIVGTFTVDTNFTFTGCSNIVMSPGALIDVLPNVQFIVDDSHMYSCGSMSLGINAQANSSVRMKGSFIEDAQYAVNLGPNAEIRSVANHFKNNYISINAISTLPANSPMSIFLNISNTVFESTRSLSPKYLGQTPIPMSHPLTGIFLNNITNVSINPDTENIFLNMNVGIIAYRTNLNVSHCTFKNILKYDSYAQVPRLFGSAIYARGSMSAYTLTYIGQHDSLHNDFENCVNGIMAKSMSLVIIDSYLKNVDIGIALEKSNLADVTIKYNTIDCNLTGISLLNNFYASSILVYGNEIRGGYSAFQNSGLGSSAIGIDLQGNNFSQFGGRHLVADNTIHLGNYGHTGIHLNYSKFFDVVENLVTLENDINTSMVGIAIEDAEQSAISCNEIDGTRSDQTIDYDEAAIRYSSSFGNVIGQNGMFYTSQGIDVIGVCDNGIDQTTIEKNFIGLHFNGLRYHGSAVVNEQMNSGNRWISPFNYPGNGAVALNIITAANMKYNVSGSGQSAPLNWYPSSFVFPNLLPDSQVDFSDCDNYGVSNPNPIPNLLKLSSDSLRTIEYQQELNWQSKVNVYKKLIEHPEYLADNPDLADFYILNAATSIHYIAQLGVERDSLLANQTTLVQNIKNNSIDIYDKSEILKQIYSALENVNLKPAEIDSLLQLSDQLMVELDQSIQLNDFYTYQLNNSIKDNIDLIGQLTDSIQGTEIYESNEEQVTGIESHMYNNPEDDSLIQFETTLTSIATQCPLSGGIAVFKARAILKGINPYLFYDDAYTCIQSGIVYRKKELVQQYCKLYPNPTSGTVIISYSIADDAQLNITDAIGRTILHKRIDCKLTNSTIDLSKFQNGLYLYQISNTVDVYYNGKIILSK